MELSQLKEKYRLSADEFNTRLQLIIETLTYKITPFENPKVVIIGGQPGCGKTELQKKAELKLDKNIVICNGDNARDFHPKIVEIKKLHEADFPELTVQVAHEWNNGLISHCQKNRLNYIMETTFASGEGMNDTIRWLKSNGYHVVIKLMAIPAAISFLGTCLRYESMKKEGGFGRRVSKKAHDDRNFALPETLLRVLNAGLYDELYIYGRDALPDRTDGPLEKLSFEPGKELERFLLERNKTLTGTPKKDYQYKLAKVKHMMIERNASLAEMNQFLTDFKPYL